MRLIDVDALIERINKNDDLPWNLDKTMQVAFISCLKHTPTAYDVDKMTEQLEDHLFDRYCIEGDDKKLYEIIELGGIK